MFVFLKELFINKLISKQYKIDTPERFSYDFIVLLFSVIIYITNLTKIKSQWKV